MWNTLPLGTKLNILEGETFVLYDLLAENEYLIGLIQRGATKEECLKYINENF